LAILGEKQSKVRHDESKKRNAAYTWLEREDRKGKHQRRHDRFTEERKGLPGGSWGKSGDV